MSRRRPLVSRCPLSDLLTEHWPQLAASTAGTLDRLVRGDGIAVGPVRDRVVFMISGPQNANPSPARTIG